MKGVPIMIKKNTKTDPENDKNYLTVEEFNTIRRMNLPKDFLDFLEIGFRTGLRTADILNLKKENIVLTKNGDGSLTERIHGTALKTKSQTPINIRLDQKSLSILKDRLDNTKSDFLFANRSGNPYTVFLGGVIISAHLTIIKFNNKYRVCYDRIFLYPQEYALPYCL